MNMAKSGKQVCHHFDSLHGEKNGKAEAKSYVSYAYAHSFSERERERGATETGRGMI